MRNHPAQIDTTIEIVTPENIAFRYRVAGPYRRLPAYLVDLGIRTFLTVFGAIGFAILAGGTGLGLMWWVGLTMVLVFLLTWFYGGLFEALWNGQTPGKRLMQIRVVSVDGQPIGGLQAVLRNVLRSIDAQPICFYQLGLWTAMMNDRFQRLGDLACGTMVVVEERPWLQGVLRTGEPQAVEMAGRIPAGFQVSRKMARALAAYVQRRRTFPRPRRLEIARHLGEPLRRKFQLPPGTNLDLLLCGLYHRTFIADRVEEPIRSGSPFREPAAPLAQAEVVTSGARALGQAEQF